MNIFVTNLDPVICASEHCDVHLRKMIVESAQILSTVHFKVSGVQVGYKPTHQNHPCVVWAGCTTGNYQWLRRLFIGLLDEYSYRFDKVHACNKLRQALSGYPYTYPFPDTRLTKFSLCMPDEYKTDDVCLSYQSYLNAKFNEWQYSLPPTRVRFTNREMPAWYRR